MVEEPARRWSVVRGDSVEYLKTLPENSVDSVVTDPPYLIGFMGKEFDSQHRTFFERKSVSNSSRFESVQGNHNPVDSADTARTLGVENRRAQEWHRRWAIEVFRVMKPGGHLLAFGGTRTYHRLASAIEDAGFEIRDTINWVYSSGFPKSHNVAKAIDRAAGAERPVVGLNPNRPENHPATAEGTTSPGGWRTAVRPEFRTGPATDEAKSADGLGTALKPAHEPIVVARKSLIGTVAENVQRFGNGALNIDSCRVGFQGNADDNPPGRWPPNLLLTHDMGCRRTGTKTVERNLSPRDSSRPSPPLTGQPFDSRGSGFSVGVVEESIDAWSCVGPTEVALTGVSGWGGPTVYLEIASKESLVVLLAKMIVDLRRLQLDTRNEGIQSTQGNARGRVRLGSEPAGSQVCCPVCCRCDDVPVRVGGGPVPSSALRLADVLERVLDHVYSPEHSHPCQCSVPLSSSDGSLPLRTPANTSESRSETTETSSHPVPRVASDGAVCYTARMEPPEHSPTAPRGNTEGSNTSVPVGHESQIDDHSASTSSGVLSVLSVSMTAASEYLPVVIRSEVYERAGCPVAELDRQSGVSESKPHLHKHTDGEHIYGGGNGLGPDRVDWSTFDDTGGASRFFPQFGWEDEERSFVYCPKAARSEREVGLEGFETKTVARAVAADEVALSDTSADYRERWVTKVKNVHPTVKPISLMRWLIRLVTPKNGLVVDPFLGSGTTGCAAVLEGVRFLGIEKDPDYVKIAEGRIEHWASVPPMVGPKLDRMEKAPEDSVPSMEDEW